MEKTSNWLDTDSFDVIIVGTDLVLSVLSGAISRIGKKVLHLERADSYGGGHTTLCLSSFVKWLKEDPAVSGVSEIHTTESLLQADREYNIDVMPKLIFASEEMVGLLIQSGVSKYLEFKAVEASFLHVEEGFRQVPCSKADVFKNDYISLLEKRSLMKFLQLCTVGKSELTDEDMVQPFTQFIADRGLNPKLQAFVLFALAGSGERAGEDVFTTRAALDTLNLYAVSIGRFGNLTPFIYPCYGTSELAQAYCRLSAVFGSIYILRRGFKELLLEGEATAPAAPATKEAQGTPPAEASAAAPESAGNAPEAAAADMPVEAAAAGDAALPAHQRPVGIVCSEGQTLRADWLVVCPSYLPGYTVPSSRSYARCVAVCSRPLGAPDSNTLLFTLPPGVAGNASPVTVLQLNWDACVAPQGKYLLHFSTLSTTGDAERDLSETVKSVCSYEQVENSDKPVIEWGAYFTYKHYDVKPDTILPDRLVVPTRGDLSPIGFRSTVDEAREIFSRMFPGSDFLPTPPDPEEQSFWGE